jgi:hypothetical protein
VTFEVQSQSNTFNELLNKLEFYDRYGVEEYYLYHPEPASSPAGCAAASAWPPLQRPYSGMSAPDWE